MKIKSTSGVGLESEVTVTERYPRAGTSLDVYKALDSTKQEVAIKTFRHSYRTEKIKTVSCFLGFHVVQESRLIIFASLKSAWRDRSRYGAPYQMLKGSMFCQLLALQ